MDKIKQMEEFVAKVKNDETLQKELAAILQSENHDDVVKANQWLEDHGYVFTLKELEEHLGGGIPLSDSQLETVAAGGCDWYDILKELLGL